MPTLKSVKSLCHRDLHGAPLVPRTRRRSPSLSPKPSSILVSETVLRPVSLLRSPSSFSALFTGFVFGTVLHSRFQPCSPDSSPEPSSVPFPLPSFILVSLLRSPSSSPEPFSILVFSSVHRSRLRNRPPSRLRYHPPSRLRYHPPSSFSAALFFGDVTKNMCKKSLSSNNRVFFKITDYISRL